jgi:hypothetical protein
VADRVTFTPGSADRIAKVVRIVEAGNRDTGGLPTSPRLGGGGGAGIKFCSWTGSWPYNGTTDITFASGTANTATATNVILGVGPGDGWVARNGSAGWSLVAFDMTKQLGYSANNNQLFGHGDNAFAQWFDTYDCSTAT